jgi:flagellar hook-associated protein 1 FlgK
MAGLTSALNIAKNALLSFQTATQVISHNVANVNNPDFSRQKVVETTYPPSPSPVGPIGSGVKIEKVLRYFDEFLERNINLRRTFYGMVSAQSQGLTILESLFNESQDTGLAKVMRDFYTAWQSLANYPENLSARTQVVETGKLIAEALKSKFEGMRDLENQIGLKLKSVVREINRLSSAIADLNHQITAFEAGGRTANDLRDQRDKLIGELSQYAQIQYFETKEGSYNVILGKGYNLVNLDYNWKLEISGTTVYWVGSNGEKVPLTSKEVPSGELGGWLKLLEQLSDSYNFEYVSGNKVVMNPLAGRTISESDTFAELGLSTGTISFQGKDHFGKEISGSFTISSSKTIREFLNEVERAFSFTVKAYIKDGRLFVEDAFRGPGKLEFSISASPATLDFGRFDDPAFQRRVAEINLAGKLKLFGEELIRAVNELHTQGVGLSFFTKELEGAYSANQYLKELTYYLDLKRDGSFFLWVKDEQGKASPIKVDLNLSEDATLDDLATTINKAIRSAGLNPDDPTNFDIRAVIRSGRLVIQARDGLSFAFSNDTAGILLSTGLNLFFHGTDPADFEVNPLLVQKPELIATGRLDVSAFRSEAPFFGAYITNSAVNPNQTFLVKTLYVRPYDAQGKAYQVPPLAVYAGTLSGGVLTGDLNIYLKDANSSILQTITIGSGTSISQLLDRLNGSQGIKAYYEEGVLRLELIPANAPQGSAYFTVDEGTSGVAHLYSWDDAVKAYKVSVNSGATGDTLQAMLEKFDKLPFLRAYLDPYGKVVLSLEPNQTKVYGFELGESLEAGANPSSSTDSFLIYLRENGIIPPAFRVSGTIESRLFSGLEHVYKPTVYEGVATGFTPDPAVSYTVRFYDRAGNLISLASVSGASTLSGLLSNFAGLAGLKARQAGDRFYIYLDPAEAGAPSGAAYFTISADDDGSLGLLKGASGALGLKMGELSAYLFDKEGKAIDAFVPSDGVVDPARFELWTDQPMFSLLQRINAPDSAIFGLSATLDRQGRLIISKTGLYKTESFVLADERPNYPSASILRANTYRQNTNTYAYVSSEGLSGGTTFGDQTITIRLLKPDGSVAGSASQSFISPTLNDIITWLNSLDLDGDGAFDLKATLDPQGKLIIEVNDKILGSTLINSFELESDGDFVPYLSAKVHVQPTLTEGLIHALKGYELKRGDNWTAQRIADSATNPRIALNLSSLNDYYASMVGEVGNATKAVRDNQTFLDDLLRQMRALKDSISGVSLDEEMANLVKYQQAFIATSKILSTVEDMFEALITAKR